MHLWLSLKPNIPKSSSLAIHYNCIDNCKDFQPTNLNRMNYKIFRKINVTNQGILQSTTTICYQLHHNLFPSLIPHLFTPYPTQTQTLTDLKGGRKSVILPVTTNPKRMWSIMAHCKEPPRSIINSITIFFHNTPSPPFYTLPNPNTDSHWFKRG